MFQELAEALGVTVPETQLYDFLKSPAAVGLNIEQHLHDMQDKMCNLLLENVPLINDMQLMLLHDFCNKLAFICLHDLLPRVHSSRKSILLKEWIERMRYLSPNISIVHQSTERLEKLSYSQKTDPEKYAKLLEATGRVAQLRARITDHVKKNVRKFMDNILKMEVEQKVLHSAEACIQFYVNTIQLVHQELSVIKKTLRFNPQLSEELETRCFQELLLLLKRYHTEQKNILMMNAEEDTEGTIHFFKTLKNCREIKNYAQTVVNGPNKSLHQEIVATLEETEQITQEQLKGTVTEMVKEVMVDVYELIADIYMKCLFKTPLNNLKKTWSRDGRKKIVQDAEMLRDKLSQLGADVQHVLLLKISALLQ
ncbi:uncharacterized protein V6R79_006381 [Siganus canaliculatus]